MRDCEMGEMLNADVRSCPHQTQLILLGRKREVDVQITFQSVRKHLISIFALLKMCSMC